MFSKHCRLALLFVGAIASTSTVEIARAIPPVSCHGDYNDDGSCDAVDYTLWRNNLGTLNFLPNRLHSGSIVEADYEAWKTNYGSTLAGGGSIAVHPGRAFGVPEPASYTLALLAAIGIALRRSRRQAIA
jgi:hypothetical protein